MNREHEHGLITISTQYSTTSLLVWSVQARARNSPNLTYLPSFVKMASPPSKGKANGEKDEGGTVLGFGSGRRRHLTSVGVKHSSFARRWMEIGENRTSNPVQYH